MSKDAQKEATIRQLYTELHKFGNNGDFDKAIKTANRSKFLLVSFLLETDVEFPIYSPRNRR